MDSPNVPACDAPLEGGNYVGYGHVVEWVDCGRLSCGCARGNGRTARMLEILVEHGDVFETRGLYGEM